MNKVILNPKKSVTIDKTAKVKANNKKANEAIVKLLAEERISSKETSKATVVTTEKQGKKIVVKYLNEGVTGKMLMNSIYAANRAHKKDMGSFSTCLNRAKVFIVEQSVDKMLAGYNEVELTPKSLIPLRAESAKLRENFSVYEVIMLIKKFYSLK